MQAIGRLSYSWYLWHWPILVIGQQILPIHGHLGNTVLALGLSLRQRHRHRMGGKPHPIWSRPNCDIAGKWGLHCA